MCVCASVLSEPPHAVQAIERENTDALTNAHTHTHTPSPTRYSSVAQAPIRTLLSIPYQILNMDLQRKRPDKLGVRTSWIKQRQNTKRQVQDHGAVQNVTCTPLYTPTVTAVAEDTNEIDSAATQPKLRRMNAVSSFDEYVAVYGQNVANQCGNEASAVDSPDSAEHIWQAPLPESEGSSNDGTSDASDVNTQDACCIQKDCGATIATNAKDAVAFAQHPSSPSPPKLLKRSYAQIFDEPELSADERTEFERNLRELRAEIKRLDCLDCQPVAMGSFIN